MSTMGATQSGGGAGRGGVGLGRSGRGVRPGRAPRPLGRLQTILGVGNGDSRRLSGLGLHQSGPTSTTARSNTDA
jgi:hypothetical protein